VSRSARWTFGPGSLEDVEVRLWAVAGSHGARMRARVSGTYRVYCGNGSEHVVTFSETSDAWRVNRQSDEFARRVWDLADRRTQDAAEPVARMAVDWALEGWDDPCEGQSFDAP
jgi:hypothetical protein